MTLYSLWIIRIFSIYFFICYLSSPIWYSITTKLSCTRASLSEGESYLLCSLTHSMNYCPIISHQPSLWLGSMGVVVCAWLTWNKPSATVVYRNTEHVSWFSVGKSEITHRIYNYTHWVISICLIQFSSWRCYQNRVYCLSFVSFKHKLSGDLRKRIQLCIYPWSMKVLLYHWITIVWINWTLPWKPSLTYLLHEE